MSSATEAARRDALAERLFDAVLGLVDVHMVHMGDRLGLYRELAKGPASPAELARRAGVDERYAREWLEQQAVSGLLDVEDGGEGAEARRFRMPAGHEEVLVDRDSLAHMAAFARMMVGMVRPVPQVLEAFRTGAGVPYAAFDADFCEGQAEANRVMFVNHLGSDWLPALPDVDRRLRSEPPARVADVACGAGWSSIAIAEAYPLVAVDGLDLDDHSIDLARRNAAGAGVHDRVRFERGDAARPPLRGPYDLVTIFEAVHDMSRPVEALRAVRGLLAPGGAVLVADERSADAFAAPGDPVERMLYGWSVLHCLPTAMVDPGAAATGAAMRVSDLRRYARAAGFSRVEVLPIESDIWRFYRLRT